jgi:2-polyprenyl-6-methoxyphenol hydroxylase-like FAD-dependent oxidoreductase
LLNTEVLIAGGGPVGLALACELGWRGVNCLLVEQNPEYGEEPVPKINLVNVRSMEFCRRWGIEPEVRHGGFPDDYPMTVQFLTSLRGKLIARLPYESIGEQPELPFSPTRRQRIPQGLIDPIMRRAAQRFESVRALFQTRLESFVDRGSHVEAEIADLRSGARRKVRARFLAACDGGRSMVRDTLEVPLRGEKAISYSCGFYFRCPALWRLHDKGKAIMNIMVDRNGMWANLNMIDGFKTWRLSLIGGDRYIPPSEIDLPGLMRRMMGDDVSFEYEMVGISPWVRRAVVADTYRKGNCFLVGDSAHQLSPTGGFGMNTGFGDAVDLGWKIEAHLQGWGGERLLDSYDDERRPIGERNVAEATSNFRNIRDLPTYPWIDAEGPEADAQRASLGERFKAMTRKEWDSYGVQLGYRYAGSPLIVSDGTDPPADDPSDYVQTAFPGSRAPHAWLSPGRSTIDLFGRGFTLLDFGATVGAAERLQRAAQTAGVPLGVHRIERPELFELYRRKLVLVRPDGHVAWRADEPPEDLLAVLARITGQAAVAATPAPAEAET